MSCYSIFKNCGGHFQWEDYLTVPFQSNGYAAKEGLGGGFALNTNRSSVAFQQKQLQLAALVVYAPSQCLNNRGAGQT
jgi:hypothetical protein